MQSVALLFIFVALELEDLLEALGMVRLLASTFGDFIDCFDLGFIFKG